MTADGDLGFAMPVMGISQVERAFVDADHLKTHPRMFKKHKVLPHPRKDVALVHDLQRSGSIKQTVETETPLSRGASSLHGSSPSARQPRKVQGRGPEPPPTPPTHSRTSSTNHPVDRAPLKPVDSPLQSTETIKSQAPATPPNPQTPLTPNLTPERTPPGPVARQASHKSRPPIYERNPSRFTSDSRTESFKTAPEIPCESDDDDGRATLRPALPSTKTSQSTVRQWKENGKEKPQAQVQAQLVGLGLGLESSDPREDLTPRTAREFNTFDGEWAGGDSSLMSEVEEEWDQNLGRNVTVRKRRPAKQGAGRNPEVIEDLTVTPTNATKALRSVSLQDSPVVYPTRRVVSDRLPAQVAPSASESSISSDMKRSSIMSTKSTASTVVEAILVETVPQRRKTLRHVRKQSALRDSSSDLSPASSAPTSVSAVVEEPRRGRPPHSKLVDATRDSQASTATYNSISSRKARRELWKNGAIPVVIVPERRSSVKSTNSKTPSLRSTSSRRSQRSLSLSSVPPSQTSKSKERTPVFDRPQRRARSRSESDGSHPGDERTIDFPPVIPTRTSSLSAPTSRNASRTGSLTADSLKAHNAIHAQHQALQLASRELNKLITQQSETEERSQGQPGLQQAPVLSTEAERTRPEVIVQRAPTSEGRRGTQQSYGSPNQDDIDSQDDRRLSVDRYGDPFFGKRLSVQNTPFSVTSVETAGTSHAEVAEAVAVDIYPHQSKSVMLVDHSAKPSESSSLERYRTTDSDAPAITTTNVNGVVKGVPSTPPQQFSVEDVDSPLRNPRAPPKPPAINFIPATPSGLTPMTEKQKMMGNYFEVASGEKPKRSQSLLRRALTGRRTSENSRPGLLARTLSLSRNRRDDADGDRRPGLKRYSSADDRPADEDRLHPYWRPSYADDDSSCCSSDEDWDDDHHDRTYRYPAYDNRPSRRRSLSARIKRTFAILPVRDDYDDEYYSVSGHDATDRRTIRRTPSGNLRVMRFRKSLESLPRIPLEDSVRPYTAPEQPQDNIEEQRQNHFSRPFKFFRRPSFRSRSRPATATGAVDPEKSGFLPNLGERINIPRRLSERRREKRTQELRKIISGPREVRDGVGDVIRRRSWREQQQASATY
ncbi:hypothetical protein QBC35DRAFT_62160 [Podospora australis]|uniref:Uncharacterized protein n=1 Tax=Podospora australis TaxID=1536484 RepID=A0AAN7ALN6_9PEZI|nr:hypothetical protein QBC35DRAFT_62160 [Podospora australis]